MTIFDSLNSAPQQKSESYFDQAKNLGLNALSEVENFAKEHKAITALGTLAAAGTIFALTRGEAAGAAATMAEGAVAGVGTETAAAATSATTAEVSGGLLSNTVFRTGALPVLSLAGLALAGCSQEKEEKVQVYTDVDQCIKDGVFTSNTCQTQFQQAQALDTATAPKFDNKKDCEDKTGVACTADGTVNGQQNNGTAATGHGSFIFYRPFMSGFMISQDTSKTSANHLTDRSAPLYTATGSTPEFVTSHGDPVSSRTGEVEVPETSLSRASKAGTAAGEGPGDTAFSRSSSSFGGEEAVSRGGFGGEGEGAHGVGGEAGGAHGGGGGE